MASFTAIVSTERIIASKIASCFAAPPSASALDNKRAAAAAVEPPDPLGSESASEAKNAAGISRDSTLQGNVSRFLKKETADLPKCEERMVELGRVGLEVLFPDLSAPSKESHAGDQEQMKQYNAYIIINDNLCNKFNSTNQRWCFGAI